MQYLCVFCGQPNLSASRFTRKNDWIGIRTFLFCSNCRGFTLTPPLKNTEMDTLYSDYYNDSTEIDGQQNIEVKFIELVKYLRNNEEIHEVLDYGCGVDGYLNSISEKLQINVDGFEVSPKTLTILQDRFPSSQFFDPISFSNTKKRYDLIVLSDVLEHLSEPKELLDSLRGKLRAGGLIWIQQPLENNRTLFTLLLKLRIFLSHSKFASIPPFHVSLGSRKSMLILLRRCGFEIVNYDVSETMWPAKNNLDFSNLKGAMLTLIKCLDKFASQRFINYGTRGVFLVRESHGTPN